MFDLCLASSEANKASSESGWGINQIHSLPKIKKESYRISYFGKGVLE